MGWCSCCQCVSDSVHTIHENIWFRRGGLLVTCCVSYLDISLDAVNAYKLYQTGQVCFSAVMVSLVMLPSIMTWAFLRANGMTRCRDLLVAVLQLEPLRELCSSWKKGKASPGLVWYVAAEGLGEAPLTGLLTAYILTFGGDHSITFYISVVWSALSMTNAAVKVNFYGKEATFPQKVVEFFNRLPMIGLRMTSLASFAYLMKEPCIGIGDELNQRTQTAIFAALLSSFSIIVALIQATEPRCPIAVSCFFAAIMLFTSPMRFLDCFERMGNPFALYRSVEVFCMFIIALYPLDINPRAHQLYENSPFLCYAMLISVVSALLTQLIRACYYSCLWCIEHRHQVMTEGGSYRQMPAEQGAKHRFESTQHRTRQAAKAGDILMTNLLINLEGAELDDPITVYCVHEEFTELARDTLVEKGLPAEISKTLKDAGVDFHYLKKLNFHAYELAGQGYSPAECKEAGYPAKDLVKERMRHISWTSKELQEGGYTAAEANECCTLEELRKGGYHAKDVRPLGFDLQELKDAGFDTAELKEAGFNVHELKECGISIDELHAGAFRASSLKLEGYTLIEMKEAGYSAGDLLNDHCYEVSDLVDIGFTIEELAAGGGDAGDLRKCDFTAEELREHGYSDKALYDGGYGVTKLLEIGCDIANLKDLATMEELNKGGCDPGDLIRLGITLDQLKVGGFSATALKKEGFSIQKLKEVGYTASDLKEIADGGLQQMKAIGFEAGEMRSAGCTAKELKGIGYTPRELREGGYTAAQLKQVGFNCADIREAGYGAGECKEAGYAAKKMHDAGYTATELKASGWTAAEVLSGGYNVVDLKQAGYKVQELKDNGFSAPGLKEAEFSAGELREAGFTVQQIKDAGYTAENLCACGVDIPALKRAGFTLKQMIAGGYGLKDLKDNNYNVKDLKAAGCNAKELKEAGFVLNELQLVGFTAMNFLEDELYTVQQLKDAGFVPGDFLKCGCDIKIFIPPADAPAKGASRTFAIEEVAEAYGMAKILENHIYTCKDLAAGGYSADRLRKDGYTAEKLQKIGYGNRDLKEFGFDQQERIAVGVRAKEGDEVKIADTERTQAECKEQIGQLIKIVEDDWARDEPFGIEISHTQRVYLSDEDVQIAGRISRRLSLGHGLT